MALKDGHSTTDTRGKWHLEPNGDGLKEGVENLASGMKQMNFNTSSKDVPQRAEGWDRPIEEAIKGNGSRLKATRKPSVQAGRLIPKISTTANLAVKISSPATTTCTTPPFLLLPVELRLEIYLYALPLIPKKPTYRYSTHALPSLYQASFPSISRDDIISDLGYDDLMPLLLACRKVNHEISSLLYHNLIFLVAGQNARFIEEVVPAGVENLWLEMSGISRDAEGRIFNKEKTHAYLNFAALLDAQERGKQSWRGWGLRSLTISIGNYNNRKQVSLEKRKIRQREELRGVVFSQFAEEGPVRSLVLSLRGLESFEIMNLPENWEGKYDRVQEIRNVVTRPLVVVEYDMG
jgi:hypothetical protein